MRIIGGEFGGRKFQPPSKMPFTRPTTDMAKEGLFNILQHRLDISALETLDLFGGTGSISYELAYSGAKKLTIVEKDPVMVEFMSKTRSTLGLENLDIVKMDVLRYLAQCEMKFDFIFAGPPYAMPNIEDLPRIIFERKLLREKGWFVLEHTTKNDFKSFPHFSFARNYGTTIFSIFIKDNAL